MTETISVQLIFLVRSEKADHMVYLRTMKHRVFLNDQGLIESKWEGDLKYGELQDMFKQTYELGFKLQNELKPVRLLIDLGLIGKVPLAEIKSLAVLGIKSFPFTKVAIFGASVELEMMTKLIMGLARKGRLFKAFKTRNEAIVWLSV